MIISTFKFEKELLNDGYEKIIGVDEAGRGPLAGPVVAAAVVLKYHPELVLGSRNNFREILKKVQHDKKEWDLIRDSKTLSEKQRERSFDFVQENFWIGVGICDHKTIDKINILEASFLAMKKAITSLSCNMKNETWSNQKKIILLDGNKEIPNFSGEQKTVVEGDKLVKSISAASIIAKVTRDKIMLEFHKKYPEYGFDAHKGYGTKKHMKALSECGPSQIHRCSFKPVANSIKK